MENFIVSARKYRPATFVSVVGQNHITSTLRNAISRGQLAHAYLFCGPRGVGKTTCARIFAKAINCKSKPGEGLKINGIPKPRFISKDELETGLFEPCGECESCRSFDEGRSFNIHELDAASNNSVEDIRNLTDQVRIPPQVGRYSVYIIDEVHMLSAAAFNAFLKTLEEPPAHAIFILATTEKHKIIPTILSRCQIFDFNRIKVSDGVDYMKHIAAQEGVAYDEESLNLIARKADGGMRDALSMFDKAVSFCGNELRYKEVAISLNILDYDTYFDATDLILAGDYAAALLLFDRVLARGFSGQTFMAGLGSHLRDLLVTKNPGTTELLDVTGPLLERYREQAMRSTVDFLFTGIALLTELDSRIRIATNQRLLVELALMKLCNLASPGGMNNGGPDDLPEKEAGTVVTVTASSATDYSSPGKKKPEQLAPEVDLPPLCPALPSEKDGTARQPQSVSEPAFASVSEPAPAQLAPAATHTKAPASASTLLHTPGQSIAPTAEPAPAPKPAPTQAHAPVSAWVPAHEPVAATTPSLSKPSFPGISGPSLSDILAGTGSGPAQNDNPERTPSKTDPEAREKIERHREKFLAKLSRENPRIGIAWGTMTAQGNKINISVASEALREEVLRYRTETLQLLAAVAGVRGEIELEVTIDETIKPSKPIKLEDRVKHLADLNPELNTLRRTLDLELD